MKKKPLFTITKEGKIVGDFDLFKEMRQSMKEEFKKVVEERKKHFGKKCDMLFVCQQAVKKELDNIVKAIEEL